MNPPGLHHDGSGLVQPRQPPRAASQSPAGALKVILLLIGNVDHSKGHGEHSARMRGELLNDIRDIARKALGTESEGA